MRPRILILHQSMGSGHKRVAHIVEAMLEETVGADIINMPANELLGSGTVKGFERWWNGAMRRDWVRFADLIGAFLFRATIVPILDALSVSATHNRLDAIAPDLIVSTADGFNKVLGSYADEKEIPFLLFTTSTSVFIDNVFPSAIHLCYYREVENGLRGLDLSLTYFRRVLTRRTSCVERLRYVAGVYWDCLLHGRDALYRNAQLKVPIGNGVRCRCVGALVEDRYHRRSDPGRVRQTIGIRNGHPTVLIACGSLGGNFVVDMVNALRAWRGGPLNLLVMCGHDARALGAVGAVAGTLGDVVVLPFPFVPNFNDFLSVSDCVIARPSAGVFNECLVSRTPYLAFDRSISSDKGTTLLVETHGLGEVCRSTGALPSILGKMLEDLERHQRNIETFLAVYPGTYEEQRDVLVGEVREALALSASKPNPQNPAVVSRAGTTP